MYDGHGGKDAADIASADLHRFLAEELAPVDQTPFPPAAQSSEAPAGLFSLPLPRAVLIAGGVSRTALRPHPSGAESPDC